jgi:hypothetical protein
VVNFFHQVVGVPVVSREILSQRTADYQNWVEAFARNHRIPIEWAEKGVRKENHVLPWQRRMVRAENYGVYYILKSMEQGPTFRVTVPKYPTKDANYRILARQRSRFTHYYFYIRDETLGPMVMRVASFLPFQTTYYLNAHSFIEQAELFTPGPWTPPSTAMQRLCELQTIRAGIVSNRTEWKNRIGSGLADATATRLAAATIEHFTTQLEAIDKAIAETIDQDAELRGRRDLLLSVVGVGETLAASLLAEMPEPGILRRSGEMIAYAGLNPSHHRSGTSIDRPTRISKIGNATLRSSLYMPALSAMRFNPAVKALVARLKTAGRLKPKQIVVAAMRKLLVICFGVLKTGRRFDPAIAMPASTLK